MVFALRQNRGTYSESWETARRKITVGPRIVCKPPSTRRNYGDMIVVQAGATFTGGFVLPKKSGTGEIVIQSSRVSELPEGERVNPSQSAVICETANTK